MKKAILSNYLWVRAKDAPGDPDVFAKEYVYRMRYIDTAQGKAEHMQTEALREKLRREDQDPDEILPAVDPKKVITFRSWSRHGSWLAFASGDVAKRNALVKRLGLTVEDRRVNNPWPDNINLKMLLPPRPHQVEPMAKWAKKRYGIFQAPPGFGKTYVMSERIIAERQRAIVFVHMTNLADMFIQRFRYGIPQDDGSFIPVTNCLEVERAIGDEVIGIYDGKRTWPITIATWQSFTRGRGEKALDTLSKEFGLLMPDEVHTFASDAPAGVISRFHARRRYGVSATLNRKDKKEFVVFDIIGPVVVKAKAREVPMVCYMHETGVTYPHGGGIPRMSDRSNLLNWLANSEERNDFIFERLCEDVRARRKIMVMGERVAWCHSMAAEAAEHGVRAAAIVGGQGKKGRKVNAGILDSMLQGDLDVIFATPAFKAGTDLEVLDTLYITAPEANALQFEQKAGRVRRWREGKEVAICRYFVDAGSLQITGCARSTFKIMQDQKMEVLIVEKGQPPATAEEAAKRPVKKMKSRLGIMANRSKNRLSSLLEGDKKAAKEGAKFKHRLGVRKKRPK